MAVMNNSDLFRWSSFASAVEKASKDQSRLLQIQYVFENTAGNGEELSLIHRLERIETFLEHCQYVVVSRTLASPSPRRLLSIMREESKWWLFVSDIYSAMTVWSPLNRGLYIREEDVLARKLFQRENFNLDDAVMRLEELLLTLRKHRLAYITVFAN